jgi:hypothetical protein
MSINQLIQQYVENLSPQLQAEVFDFVLFLEQKQIKQSTTLNYSTERKQNLISAFDKLMELNLFVGIDGVEWQKEQRY